MHGEGDLVRVITELVDLCYLNPTPEAFPIPSNPSYKQTERISKINIGSPERLASRQTNIPSQTRRHANE